MLDVHGESYAPEPTQDMSIVSTVKEQSSGKRGIHYFVDYNKLQSMLDVHGESYAPEPTQDMIFIQSLSFFTYVVTNFLFLVLEMLETLSAATVVITPAPQLPPRITTTTSMTLIPAASAVPISALKTELGQEEQSDASVSTVAKEFHYSTEDVTGTEDLVGNVCALKAENGKLWNERDDYQKNVRNKKNTTTRQHDNATMRQCDNVATMQGYPPIHREG